MNETNEKKEQAVKNPALFNVESFNKAVASRDEIIVSHETTISSLEEQIGKQQTTISELMKKNKELESARVSAESKVSELKNLKKDSSLSGGYKPKTEEEKFAEDYQKAKARLNR